MSIHTTRRPRSDTSPDRSTRSMAESHRSNIGNTPIHHKALGVVATLSIDSQNMLTNHVLSIAGDICDAEGLNYDEVIKSGMFNIREGHRITVAPLTQIGAAMHESAKGSRSAQPYIGGDRRANYKQLKPTVVAGLRGYSNLRGKSRIVGFDWYGTNKNVLVALLDEQSDVYRRLQGAQDAVKHGLATVGLDDCSLYPPNHITILRMGTKKNPLKLSDEAKKVAIHTSSAKLDKRKKRNITDGVSSIGSVAINGLTIIEADTANRNTKDFIEPYELKTTVAFEI